jgi:type I restriction enzyme S subunit
MKIANIDVAINQDLRGLILNNFINNKFLTYCFQTFNIIGNGTIVKSISVDTLNKISIPVPPIAEQKRIVSLLDKFDTLVNDISIGLPAELSARRQQYEYYRDRLLDFREVA